MLDEAAAAGSRLNGTRPAVPRRHRTGRTSRPPRSVAEKMPAATGSGLAAPAAGGDNGPGGLTAPGSSIFRPSEAVPDRFDPRSRHPIVGRRTAPTRRPDELRSDPLATVFPPPVCRPSPGRGLRRWRSPGATTRRDEPPLVLPGGRRRPVADGAGGSTPARRARDPGRPRRPASRGAEEKAAILDNVIKLIQAAAVNPGGSHFGNATKNLNQYFEGDPAVRLRARPEGPGVPADAAPAASRWPSWSRRPGRCPTPGTWKTACSTRGSPAGSAAWATT